MCESIFYQVLEYVIAPIGLMMIIFFVKNSDDKNGVFAHDFRDDGIESLFIAAYSHILFYFSVSAHPHEDHRDIEDSTKTASLLVAVLGVITTIILKHYSKVWGDKTKKYKAITNNVALLLMANLLFIICYYNSAGWDFSFLLKKPQVPFWHRLSFLLKPNNFIFIMIASFVLVMRFYLQWHKHKLTNDVKTFLRLNRKTAIELLPENKMKDYTSIARNAINPLFVRIDSLLAKAKILEQNKETLHSALIEVERAKEMARNVNYPENLLYGIRKLKIQILCKMSEPEAARLEIAEIMFQNLGETNIEMKEMRENWIKWLEKGLEKCEFVENG